MKAWKWIAAVGVAWVVGMGCEGGDEPPVPTGPITDCPCYNSCQQRQIQFQGYTWTVKQEGQPLQAGRNCYSGDPEDVWVDDQRRLHLKIRQRDGRWVCTEVSAQGGFGYGKYVFHVANEIDTIDRNVVVGLFTWDDAALAQGYLSELDVEITRWGTEYNKNLYYSVQPVYGPDTESGHYDERTHSEFLAQREPGTTHVISWRADRVDFASYHGFGEGAANRIATWSYDQNNPARRADLQTLTTPITIPPASPTVSVRLNVWLKDVNQDGFGDPPSNGQEAEVIIDHFEFQPY